MFDNPYAYSFGLYSYIDEPLQDQIRNAPEVERPPDDLREYRQLLMDRSTSLDQILQALSCQCEVDVDDLQDDLVNRMLLSIQCIVSSRTSSRKFTWSDRFADAIFFFSAEIVLLIVEHVGMDVVNCEFLPSGSIYDIAVTVAFALAFLFALPVATFSRMLL